MPTVEVRLYSRRPPDQSHPDVFASAANSLLSQPNHLPRPIEAQLPRDDDWSVGEESAIVIKQPQRLKSAPVPIDRRKCILPSTGPSPASPPLRPPSDEENTRAALHTSYKQEYETLALIRQYFLHRFEHPYVDPIPHSTHILRSAKVQHSFVKTPATYLQPGRRGTWLIPLQGSFSSIVGSSPTSWATEEPSTKGKEIVAAIIWNKARLDALWAMLGRMQASSRLGHIVGFVHIEDDSLDSLSSKAAQRSPPAFPPHIRIGVDGHFALPIRFVLGYCVGGGGDGENEDKVEFLLPKSGIRLAYVDEVGRPILLA